MKPETSITTRATLKQAAFILAALFCLTPWCSSAFALILGVVFALTLQNPFASETKSLTPRLLSGSVVGLGAGMNLIAVAHVGAQGIGYTVVTIGLAFAVGLLLGRWLKIERNTSLLITVGTAICGGSAIAAVSPVIRARSHEISVALGIVFLLNALALFVFPVMGHALALTEPQFGLWCALAIHDTSSVVGAAMRGGPHALVIATTVKLARALWIVPVTLCIGALISQRAEPGVSPKAKRPYFIAGFLIAAALVTFVPGLAPAGHLVNLIAQRVLVLTLFLIGSNLSRDTIRAVGFKPFVQGIGLWIVMASTTLIAITYGWISAS